MEQYFPFWKKLTHEQRALVLDSARQRHAAKGEILHHGSDDCVGVLIVKNGILRVFTLSEEGREITLYRLRAHDFCLFSAACIIHSIHFDVMVQAEQDTEFIHVPSAVYQQLMQESIAVSNYTNEVMAARFSDVMWLMDQILYKRMDTRVAAFLLEESQLQATTSLKITHEAIARHLGSAREVITRMLRYLQSEGAVSLSRGGIQIKSTSKLREIVSNRST